jgi:hypothetical protein
VISERFNQLPDHEARLRALERFRWTLVGASLFGGMLSGFAGYLLSHLVH